MLASTSGASVMLTNLQDSLDIVQQLQASLKKELQHSSRHLQISLQNRNISYLHVSLQNRISSTAHVISIKMT